VAPEHPGVGADASSAALARHPHLAAPRPQGTVRIDCHVHTMWSGDSTTTPHELAAAVSAAGMDVVCITDHGTIAGAQRIVESGDFPCRVVVGQEQRTPEGEVIGLFLSERIPAGMLSALDAARSIREQGGLVYLPHPLDPMRHRLSDDALAQLAEKGLVDVVEVLNAKTSLRQAGLAAESFAADNRIAAGAGSDCHVPEAMGAAYVEAPSFPAGDPTGFLTALAVGRIIGHRSDPPRAWRSRIVPSSLER
jgi:predicted metal-dependent phosphoesterase TrpH